MKFLNLILASTVLSIVSCGTAQSSETSLSQESKIYSCMVEFFDYSLQDNSLYYERFEVDMGSEEAASQILGIRLGVSPGDGKYYAGLTISHPDGISANIYNSDTGAGIWARYPQNQNSLFVSYKTSHDQRIYLNCNLNK